MDKTQHTTTRRSKKNNLDIQKHAKTNQQSNRRKTRIQQQNNSLKTNNSLEKFLKTPLKYLKITKTTPNNHKTKETHKILKRLIDKKRKN